MDPIFLLLLVGLGVALLVQSANKRKQAQLEQAQHDDAVCQSVPTLVHGRTPIGLKER